MLEGRFKPFGTTSEIFQRFPKTSDDFRRSVQKNSNNAGWLCKGFCDNFQNFPKISEDFKKFRKLVGMLGFAISGAFC